MATSDESSKLFSRKYSGNAWEHQLFWLVRNSQDLTLTLLCIVIQKPLCVSYAHTQAESRNPSDICCPKGWMFGAEVRGESGRLKSGIERGKAVCVLIALQT